MKLKQNYTVHDQRERERERDRETETERDRKRQKEVIFRGFFQLNKTEIDSYG